MLSLDSGSPRFIGRPALIAAAFVAVVCCSIVAIEVWRMVESRRAQVAEGEASASNLAKSIADQATSTFLQADALLSGLVERLEVEGTSEANVERIHRLIQGQKADLQQLQRLSIIDARGHWVTTDLPSIDRAVDHSERAYFRHHLTHDDRAVHLGPPILSKSTSEWIVTISRRFNDRDGAFAGVVLASVSLRFFSTYYEQFDIGHHGAILFAMADGTVVNRRPFKEEVIGTSIADGVLFREHIVFDDHGTAWNKSRFDGVERLTAFRKTEVFPAYALVALSRDEILAPWMKDTITHGSAALLLVVLLATVGGHLIAEIARRHRDQVLLVESRTALLEANQRLEDVAREDALTGIANRRELDRVLDNELQRATRRGGPLALLMIDVDHFKSYNDTYGHVQGDACLKHIAKLVAARASRPGDLAARYGGEEFVVLLPETDIVGARNVADKIRASFHRAAQAHAATTHGIVTVSIGVAAMRSHMNGFGATALVERADRALYAAKSAGRDTIRSMDDDDRTVDAPWKAWSPPACIGPDMVTIV